MSNDLDHKEFIVRQHRYADQEQEVKHPAAKAFRPFIWGAFSVVFLALFIGISLQLWELRALPISDIGHLAGLWAAALLFLVYAIQRVTTFKHGAAFDFSLLDAVIEGSRGARLITDPSDQAVYFNKRFLKLCKSYGTPGLSALAKLFEQNEIADRHFEALADQAHRGLTGSIDLCTLKSGQECWYLIAAQPVTGWPGYIHWRIDDITEKHKARQAKDEEREKLIDFTDNAPVGFFSVNEEGRFIFANATFARWVGVDMDALLKDYTLHAFLQDVADDTAPYDVIKEGGARQVAEVKMKGPAGKTFLASISQTVVMNDEQNLRTRAVVHDMTSESAMRHALQASEDRFMRFFEEAPLGIVMLDKAFSIRENNRAFSDMINQDVKGITNKSFLNLIHPEDHDRLTGGLKKVNSCETVESLTDIRVLTSGDSEDKAYTYTVVYGRHFERQDGEDNIVLHFIDTSEKKDLEQQFAQSQKMQAVGQLAGGVAHDFNNLLTAIIGFCDLLLLRHKPGDPSFQDIMQIKQNSNRASNLVRQLLAFSRQQTLRPKVQDITDILTEVSHLVRRLLGANVELDIVHGQSLGLVRVDGGQMEQVIINMAVNARDAMDGAGQLTIETEHYSNKKAVKIGDDEMAPGHWVKIIISDTGSGISPENLERIFEPFFTTKDVGKGTGLGLATVYGIIRQTGGFLKVDSTVGEGTSFTVFLPVAQEIADDEGEDIEETPEKEAPKPRDLTGTARILLVEDEDAVRNFSERALNNKGYEVIGADCGESAVEVIEQEGVDTFDLVITDVIMPNMDGPTLANKIREQRPTMKIIFVSGYTEEKLKEHMGENIYFLPKPFSLKQLAEKVKEVLG